MNSSVDNTIYNIWLFENNIMLSSRIVTCLRQSPNIYIHILSSNKTSPVKYSRFVKSYITLPEKENEWVEFIENTINKYSNNLILPSTEEHVQFVIDNYKSLEKFTNIADVPDSEMFNIAINKGLLSDFLKNNSIVCPDTLFNSGTVWEGEFPVLFKPVRSDGGRGIQLCNNAEEIKSCIGSLSSDSYILQQYIDGEDVGCSVLCGKGSILAYTIQEGVIYNKKQFAPEVAIEFIENEDVLSIIRKLMSALNWSGVAHIDLYRDKATGELFVIEINGRYWASLLGSLKNGVNFPVLAVQESFDLPFDRIKKKYHRYASFSQVIKQYLGGNKINLALKFSESNLCYIFNDPLPSIVGVLGRIKRALKSRV